MRALSGNARFVVDSQLRATVLFMSLDLRTKRAVITAAVLVIAFAVMTGMAGMIDKTTAPLPEAGYPEGSIVAELGSIDPIVLPDATEVMSLVESPDPGLVEVGIRITRGGGLVEVLPGEFTLVTDDGRTFTPTELIEDGNAVVFTINAPIGEHRFQVRWTRANMIRLVLVDELPPAEVSA
jgi:hypothetical protein